MTSIRDFASCHLICCVVLATCWPIASGQEVPAPSTEERSSLIAERDAKGDQAIALANRGEFEKALELFDRVFEIEQSVFGEAHEELLGTLDLQTQIAHSANDWSQEIEFRRRAHEMGGTLYDAGDYRLRDLELALIESRDNATRTEGQRRQLSAAKAASRDLGALFRQGRYVEAIKLGKRITTIRGQLLGEEHPAYARSLNNLAALHHSMGDHARAEQLYLTAKRIREKTLGREHPEYATNLNNLAELYRSRGGYARAVPLFVEAKTIREKTFGMEHPAYALSLNNLAGAYKSMGDYARAEPLFVDAKEIREKTLGKEHPDYANSLNNLAGLYESLGDYARAEPLYEEAKTIRLKTLGEQHPAYATSLNNLAALYASKSEYARAEKLFIEAQTIRAATLGKEHPGYGSTLNSLAALYEMMGDYGRAEALYIEAKSIRGKSLGKEHPDYAASLNNLASLYLNMGDYAQAETLMLEARAIEERTLGKDHPDYAAGLNNLASLYARAGDNARAEPLHVEAKRIWENTVGKEHPDYASGLNNLAGLYVSMADYARAEPLYIEARKIRARSLGKEHPLYATVQTNLARLYESMGDDARAEPLYIEAKMIRERALGKEHPDYATSLNNLAALYESMGEYARAEALHVDAKTIRAKVLGKEHPDYAASLNNLAYLYDSMGDDARAEPLYVEVIEVLEKTLGHGHPRYGDSLNNLASLYTEMGDYARAEPLLVEAKKIKENTLGKKHPSYALSLNNLAVLYKLKREFTRAEPLYREAIDVTLNHLKETAFIQSEQQQVLLNQAVRHRLDNYLVCCIEGDLDAQHAVARIVAWKGSILLRGRGLRLADGNPSITDQFRQLRSVASQISAATRSVPAAQNIDAWKKRLDSLVEQQRGLESELMRSSDAFREAVKEISFDDVRDSIPDRAVLVDFLEHGGEKSRSLLASVIRREGDPVLVDLGSATAAGDAIDTWRESYGMTSEAKSAGLKLRRQLWQPLLKYVDGAELILVSTDGVMGRLPLAALPGSAPGTFLIEDHRVVSIPVPRMLPDIVAQRDSNDADAQRLLLVGDVDYGATEANRAQGDLNWPSLRETGREVEFIKELFQQNTQSGEQGIIELREGAATESAFRTQAPKCQLLHLATHGFFAAADKKNAFSPSVIARSRGSMQRSSMFGEQRDFVVGFSPGQLSGLVFAGANRSRQSIDDESSDDESSDDGIMTADEIAFLPLEGVELAVLSACETGLGEVAGGEGLIGIQRAFQVAGVDSVVATMWKVDDTVTRKLMERFYRNLVEAKMSKLDALRDAQLWVLRNPSIVAEADKERGVEREEQPLSKTATQAAHASPYYWAPFVLSGDWR